MLRIKEILEEKKVAQKHLAAQVGVTPATINNIIKGKHFPGGELLRSIASALDVDIRMLFEPTKSRDKEPLYVKRDGKFIPIGEIKKYDIHQK